MKNREKRSIKKKSYNWVDERYNISGLIEFAKKKSVPQFRETIWYYFGGIALLLFIIQVLSGILLLMYYQGTENTAYESVKFISTKVSFGWLIRSVHSWSANLMVFAAFIHMFSVYFLKSFRKPRELTWYTGFILLALAMGFGFSGYLLPWNELAFFATKVGTDITSQIPLIGEGLLILLRGGEEVTGATLSRFFGFHVAVLPGFFTVFLALHLLFIQRQGMNEPEEWTELPENKKKYIPFFPNFTMRELLIWLIVINVLAILAVFFPWELGNKADPFASAPVGIRPEWYFMFMFQVLKMLPGKILFLSGEFVGIAAFGIGILLWFLVPFWDRRTPEGKRNRLLTYVGIFVVFFIIIFTILGFILD
jgi:cytochrome b6